MPVWMICGRLETIKLMIAVMTCGNCPTNVGIALRMPEIRVSIICAPLSRMGDKLSEIYPMNPVMISPALAAIVGKPSEMPFARFCNSDIAAVSICGADVANELTSV